MLLLASPLTEASSLINVPLNPDLSDFNRETYRFVHRLLNKRVLPGIRRGSLPLTRKQVASYLLEVHRKQQDGEITLSTIDQERLNALLAFYSEAGTQIPPRRRLPPNDDGRSKGRSRLSFLLRSKGLTTYDHAPCR